MRDDLAGPRLNNGCSSGRAAIQAVLHHPDVRDVQVFFCGIDADNRASRRCATAAGFRLVDPGPDHEGMLYYRHEPAIALHAERRPGPFAASHEGAAR